MQGLPPESATFRDHTWSPATELAAALLEQLDYWGRSYFAFNGVKGSKLPKPLQIPRPSQRLESKKRVMSDPAEVRRFFHKHLGG